MSALDILLKPLLGPWFAPDLKLPEPGESLGLTLSNGTFVAPVQGLASVAIAPAPILAPFLDHKGARAFPDGSFVVVLRLLPAVEARLIQLATRLPELRRASVRTLAIALAEPPAPAKLGAEVLPGKSSGQSQQALATYLGLRLSADGTKLQSGGTPVQCVVQRSEKLLTFPGNATLWAFDPEGHPIDPGAVAAWWRLLAKELPSDASWEGNEPTIADRRTVQLVAPSEGSLSSDDSQLLSRLSLSGLAGGAGLYAATGAVTVARTNAQDTFLRVASLPDGTYGDSAAISWSDKLKRDFVRIGVVDLEPFLVGVSARSQPLADAPSQASETTRVDIARCAGTDPVLCTTTDQALDALLWSLDRTAQSGEAWLVCGGASPETGPLTTKLADLLLPIEPIQSVALSARALIGSGQSISNTFQKQRVLLEIKATAEPQKSSQGAWVRVWPHRLDTQSGRRVRMNGGGGLVGADGFARVVVTLPDGSLAASAAPLSADVLVVTRSADGRLRQRLFVDQRFERPAPVAGTAIIDLPGGAEWWICETGKGGTGAATITGVPSGATVVLHKTNPAQIVRPPASAFGAKTLGSALRSGDRLVMFEPAWRTRPDRLTDDGRLSAVRTTLPAGFAAAITQLTSGSLPNVAPPGLERREITAMCSSKDSSGRKVDRAALATTPLLSCFHEPGEARATHPGAPACAETHGTGARLLGPAARLLAEHVRDRSFPNTHELALDALAPLATVTSALVPGPWVAVLKTGARTLDVEPLVPDAVNALRPLAAEKIGELLQKIGAGNVPGPFADLGKSLFRALDRRIRLAQYGAREGQRALVAAIARAERFVYIETPVLRSGTPVFDALKARLGQRPGMHVLLCIPAAPQVGTPQQLRALEPYMIREAVRALTEAAPGRVVAFAPTAGGERPLRLSATSVVIDDVFAFTGSTHLSRRGLSFDGSLAVALFDERLDRGRPREARAFRLALIQARLGLTPEQIPEDPAELLELIRLEQERGGDRVARIPEPALTQQGVPTASDLDRTDPDGGKDSLNFTDLLNLLITFGAPAIGYIAELDEIELPPGP